MKSFDENEVENEVENELIGITTLNNDMGDENNSRMEIEALNN